MAKKITEGVDDVVGADSSALATETIAMRRDYDESRGGPTHADVHPDEVGHWQSVGWLIVAEPAVNEPD